MHNYQEDIIAKRQELMNYCINETLNTLTTAIRQKAEVLSDDAMAEIEGKEFARVVDELADIYEHYPAVHSIRNYIHRNDFLWESTFIESINKEEKSKWFHSTVISSYENFCKDKTVYDEVLPYFSVIYKMVVDEKYMLFLKERKERRDNEAILAEYNRKEHEAAKTEAEIESFIANLEQKLAERKTASKKQGKTDEIPDAYPPLSTPPAKPSFEHTLTDTQIDHLASIVNELHIFHNDAITSEQLKSVFDCNPAITLKSKNNRLLAHLFDQLSRREYIAEDWQSVIAKNNLFLSSQKEDYLNQNDLSTAVSKLRDIAMTGKYAKIELYIKNLKAH